MSLHKDETFCTKNHEDKVGWQAACECGWEAEGHFSSNDLAHREARRDYRSHVEKVLGANAYYNAAVACKNCGSRHTQPILIGTPVYQNSCQNCGQTFLIPDNEVWHEETERVKGLGF